MGILAYFGSDVVLAQIPRQQAPSFPLVPKPIEPIPQPQPIPETPLEVPKPINPMLKQTPDIPGGIIVARFEFEGSTVFRNEEQIT